MQIAEFISVLVAWRQWYNKTMHKDFHSTNGHVILSNYSATAIDEVTVHSGYSSDSLSGQLTT